MLVVCCVFSHTDGDDRCGRRGDTARALARWQRLVASREATVALHQAMLIALYRPGGMVIEIAVELVTFVNIIEKRAARKKIFLPHFYDLAKSLQPRPRPTPRLCCPHAELGKTKKLAPLEGGKACHGGNVCVVCCVLIYILPHASECRRSLKK